MNDVMTATEAQEESGKEAREFVELGSVSEETKGYVLGDYYDGGLGRWNDG